MYLFTYSIYVQVATFMFVEQKGFTFEKVWFKVLNQKISTWYFFIFSKKIFTKIQAWISLQKNDNHRTKKYTKLH